MKVSAREPEPDPGPARRQESGGKAEGNGEVIGIALHEAELAGHVAEDMLEDERAADGGRRPEGDGEGRLAHGQGETHRSLLRKGSGTPRTRR